MRASRADPARDWPKAVGGGTVGRILAPLFGEVVGVDPDADMVAEAERLAVRAGLSTKARWLAWASGRSTQRRRRHRPGHRYDPRYERQ